MRTLVVGGTGPTGPFIVNGLRERGREVTIFHRGTHEIPEIPDDVRHIHGDPHFAETIADALAGETFDEVIATYGRIRLIAEAFAGQVGRFISVGGVAVYRGFSNPRLGARWADRAGPGGRPVADDEVEERFGMLIAQTEDVGLRQPPDGHGVPLPLRVRPLPAGAPGVEHRAPGPRRPQPHPPARRRCHAVHPRLGRQPRPRPPAGRRPARGVGGQGLQLRRPRPADHPPGRRGRRRRAGGRPRSRSPCPGRPPVRPRCSA